MKSIKMLSMCAAILAISSVYAQTTTATKTDYGDNPNIFKVLAHKTGEKVQNTAERVGAATERGIEKIKPKVDNTLQEAKTYTEEQTERAKVGLQRGAEKVTETTNNARDTLVGTNKGGVPIERGYLSQSSSITTAPQAAPAQIANTTTQTIPLETPASIPAPSTANTIDPTQQNRADPEEPEISFKVLPLPQVNPNTTSTVETPQTLSNDATQSTEVIKEDIPQ